MTTFSCEAVQISFWSMTSSTRLVNSTLYQLNNIGLVAYHLCSSITLSVKGKYYLPELM